MDSKGSNLLEVLSGTFAEGEPKDLSQPIDESECAENYGYHSDSDLEDDDVDVKAGETPRKTATLRGHPFDPFCFSISDETSTYGQHNELVRKGKVVKVRDIAFVTYAFLYPCRHAADDFTDFRPFYFIYTRVPSSLRHTDRRRTASQGVMRSFPYQKTRYLDRHQSRSIVSQIRSPPSFAVRMLE